MKKTFLSVSLALALLLPSAALAQATAKPAPPLRASEQVIVTQSTSGQELRGYLVELSPTSLAILVDGRRVEVPIDRVLRIEGRNDSVRNGAAYGAAITAGLSVFGCSQVVGRAGPCLAASFLYAGMGALIGAGVDALHKGRTTIYSKPSGTALAVAPTRGGARAQLTVRW